MQVLRIEHDDFELFIDSGKYAENVKRAEKKQLLQTRYAWSGTAIPEEIFISKPDGTEKAFGKDTEAPVVFFENTAYDLMLAFREGSSVKNVRVFSVLKDINGSFVFRKGHLYGSLNFGNDIGKSRLEFRYEKNGESCTFAFEFEVFPVKLDYKNDLKSILQDIEEEYPEYVLDYLHKTYLNFKEQSSEAKGPEVIWWNIFRSIQLEFLQACRRILSHPSRRLLACTEYRKAGRICRFTPAQEEEYVTYRDDEKHLYRCTSQNLSADTTENRFLKYVLEKITGRYTGLMEYIQRKYHKKLSEEAILEMKAVGAELKKYRSHPFFRTVGRFRGVRQESLVLQRAPGYAVVYRDWMMLKCAYAMLDGMHQMETKDIAHLYEVWCFIMLKKMIEQETGVSPDRISTVQADGKFVFEFRKGTASRIQFIREDGSLVDLYYNPKFTREDKPCQLPGAVSVTVPQQPDIILRITRNDLHRNYTLTYLFDAKYRLKADKDGREPDLPPDDAINQMHRYRDAIFFKDKKQENEALKREVIGGYILFPGDGKVAEIRKQRYYLSVGEVNIGAFPLCPHSDNPEVRELLKGFVGSLLMKSTDQVMEEIIPHKGMVYESPNPDVLVGVTHISPEKWEHLCEQIYVSGAKMPAQFGKRELRYFAPYFPGKGVAFYYEIEGYSVQKRKEVYSSAHPLYKDDSSERLVIKLGKKYVIQGNKYFVLDGVNPYRYLDLKCLTHPVGNKIEVNQ